MKKRVISKEELQKPKLEGVDKIANIVKQTLGPGGRVILIERVGQALDGSPLSPKLTKDGVSVAEECSDQDPSVDVVIQTIKNICKKTNSDAGDGTTTAIVLGQALVHETEKVLEENPEANPQLVKENLEKASKEVIENIVSMARPVREMSEIAQVATISANGDTEIGKLISEAFSKVGSKGVVTIDEGRTNKVELDVVDGYQFNRGAEARDAFFNTSHRTHFEAEDSDKGVAVLIYDGKINSGLELIPALKAMSGIEGDSPVNPGDIPPMLIVANEFSRDALQFLIIKKAELNLNICCVRGPHTTNVRTGYYDDLAVYMGAKRLGNGNESLGSVKPEHVGRVDRVIVDKYKTTFYDGHGYEEDVLERVEALEVQKSRAESAYDAQVINDRIAALTNGIAKIAVGGNTQLEIKEKYDRIEDALNAARAAIAEGIVPGGGSTLLRQAAELDISKGLGYLILKKALKAPFLQILENIGVTDKGKTSERVQNEEDVVFDARHKKLENCWDKGIVDPVKVTRSALQNAISISGLLTTSGGAIIYEKS